MDGMAKRSVTRPGWMDGDERRLLPPPAGLPWRMGRAPGTWICGSPSPNSCRGRGTNVGLAALGLQRVPTMPPCFFGGLEAGSPLLPAHPTAARAGRHRGGITKTTPPPPPAPRPPPKLGSPSLFLVWPTQAEFTRDTAFRLEMDAACCSGHRRKKKLRKKGTVSLYRYRDLAGKLWV